MKKFVTLLFVLCLVLTMTGFAKEAAKPTTTVTGIVTDPMCAKSGDKAKMADADCAKKCASDGKYALVNDADGSVWTITNPELVKGHEGHHVTVTAHLDADKKEAHLMRVSMAREKPTTKLEKKKKS